MFSKFNFSHNNIHIFQQFNFFFHKNHFFGFYRDIWHRTFWPLSRESLDLRNYRGPRETTVADCCYNPASALHRGQSTRDTQNERTPGHYICRKGGICDSCRMEWMNCHVNPPKLKKMKYAKKVYKKAKFRKNIIHQPQLFTAAEITRFIFTSVSVIFKDFFSLSFSY